MKFVLTTLFAISWSVITLADESPLKPETHKSVSIQTRSNCPCSSRYLDSTVPHVIVGPATAGPIHIRHPYYSYRRPWYPPGQRSLNVTIVW